MGWTLEMTTAGYDQQTMIDLELSFAMLLVCFASEHSFTAVMERRTKLHRVQLVIGF